MTMNRTLPFVLLLCLMFPAVPARAGVATDALIDGAKQCTRHLPRYERQYGIPVHLLSAIASTESGRWHKGLKITLPWPWTINAEGKGFYFDTKEEAIAAARRMRAEGVKSMDIGCMQVNLLHHPEAFNSLEEAFTPENNVAYAAYFLRNLFDEQKSWKEAAAAYHSRNDVNGKPYVGKVYERWYTIIDRVRAARLASATAVSAPTSGGLTQDEAASAREASRAGVSAPVKLSRAVPAPAPKAPARSTPAVQAVSVKKAPTPERPPLLVQAPKPITLPAVEVKPVEKVKMPAITADSGSVKAAPPPARVASAVPPIAQNSGPRFIFRD